MKKQTYYDLHLRMVDAAEKIDSTLRSIHIASDYSQHVNLFNRLALLLMRSHNLIETLCVHDRIPNELMPDTSKLLRDILNFNGQS